MKRVLIGLALFTLLLSGCAGVQSKLEKTAGPPAVPRPPQVTSAEITAGTETALRSYSPEDVKSFVDTHGATGIVEDAAYGAGWNADTAHSPSQNSVYDILHTYDTDDDGDIDNVDGAVGGGDITGVGPGGTGAGDAYTDGYATSGSVFIIQEGTTVDTNEFEIDFPSADPGADVTVTFPDQTGTFIVGPGAGMSDNVIPRVDGATSHLLQASGITIDDSNNLAGIGTISSGAITATGTSTFADAISPDSADSATIGSATAEWSDLYLASGGVIYGESDQSNTLTSSATAWTFGLDVVITGSDLTLGAAGVKFTGDGDGAFTVLGLGDGSDEDLTLNLDDTADTVVVSSSTGVTLLSLTSIGITTGAANNFSAGTTTLGTVAGTITDGTASWNTSTQDLAGFATVAATTGVTSPLYDVSGAAAITIGSADVTAVTITTDNTGDGTDLVLPAQSVNGSEMLNNTVTATQLSATLTMADGDLIDMGGITHTGSADEGLVLPTWANVTPTSDKKFLAADGSSLKLYNGGWVTIGATAAPTDAQYVTLALDATLSAERVLTAGYALDFTDAGANDALTVAVDTTEISADGSDTFSDGSQASVAWTVDTNDTADNVITFTNGLTTFNDAVTVTDTLTATNGIALGTSKSITGTTGLTLGGGTETVAINSSDWDIDATGVMTGIGNVTSDGVVTATGFTIGSAAITETELEILDGATLTTTQINYLNAATGTTGTTNTNVVFSASPTFTGTVVAADIDGSGTFSANLFTPDGADGADIGSATLEFSDIYIADGSVIYGGNDQDSTITHVPDAGWQFSNAISLADNKNLTFGGTLGGYDWSVSYDETTNDALQFVTAATASAAATTPMFKIQADSGAAGMTADQDIFSIYKGTTELFTVDEDGDVYVAGAVTTEPTNDPGIIFNESTASDTDYWMADNADQEGDNDDLLSIGTGITIGTGTIWYLNPSGDMVVSGSTTTSALTLEGGTYDTTFSPGTPTESVTYQWPLADGGNGQALVTNGSGTLSFSDITATPAGATGNVQYNATTLGAEAAFTYNATNNTLSITQAASNPTLQLGDGTFSWGHTPQLGVEGISEFDSTIYADAATGLVNAGVLDQNEDVDIDFDANDEELSLDSTAVDYAAGAGIVTIHGDHVGNTNDAALLRLVYQANGDAQDTFILCEDNSTGAAGNGDDMFKVASGGVVTAAGLGTFSGGVTIGTGTHITVGAVQWDNGSDAIDGEQIANDTIDDDSIDFADVTLDDFVSAEGDYISVATDDTFDFTRNDAGTVTITASDDDAIAALTVVPGGAAALTLGGASTTAITLTTDSTGDAEVVLPNDSIGPDEMASGTYNFGTSVQATTLTDGTLSVSSGAVTGLASATDGTASWSSSNLSGFGTITASTSVTAPLYDVTGAAGITFGSADLTAFTFSGQSEDLVVTPSADTWTLSSSTGVTTISAGSLNLATTGTITGGIASNTDADGMTQGEMTTAGIYGVMYFAGGAGTWNLPAVATGASLCVYSTTAAAIVINPDNADRIILDGTALADGDSITSASAAGDFICIMADSAAGWVTLGRSGTWTDTN